MAQSTEQTLETWLASHDISSLLPVLIEEEIEKIEDLLIFESNEIRKVLLDKKTIKLGKIAKLIKALDNYRNIQNHQHEHKQDEHKDNNNNIEENDGNDEKEYKYQHDFDAKGILYAIGTDFGEQDYKNPLGKVKFNWQGLMSNGDHDTGFVGRSDHGDTVKTNLKDVWYAIDFNIYQIKPTRYTLRSCYDYGRQRALDWELQASNDQKNWICLRKHDKVKLKKGEYNNGYSSIHSWIIDNVSSEYYQHFRIYIINWKANDSNEPNTFDKQDDYIYLNISGLEMYGKLRKKK